MLIEIRKAGFINKGAELMLRATLEKVSKEFPDATFVISPDGSTPYEKQIALGFWQKVYFWRYGVQWGRIFEWVPSKLRRRYGIVTDTELSVVLDAAGFAYSDQWGPRDTIELAKSSRRWKKLGVKVILLPQAFGPFSSKKIKDAINEIADNVDLIFPREQKSYEYLVGAVGKRPNIEIAPDFTNLIEGILPAGFDLHNNKFAIVPNYRMVDKTNANERDAYLPFLSACAKYLLESNTKPFLLVHEGINDLLLAEQVKESVGGAIPIVKETNPLAIKGILGSCDGTIGSRFHGLVSALSQGVPSLATGWSHKYQKLFDDYGFPDGMLSPTVTLEELKYKINIIIDKESNILIRSRLIKHSEILKKNTDLMWKKVFRILYQ